LLLLAAFTLGVARVLRGGEEVECNCFGSLAPSKVSGWTLARNGALIVLAGFVAGAGWSEPGASALGWIGDLDATAALGMLAGLALLAAVVNFAFSWQLMKQNGRLVVELAAVSGGAVAGGAPKGLPLGEMAPAFTLPTLAGRPVELDELLDDGRRLLLFFSDSHCSACEPLLPEIGRRQRDPEANPRVAVLSLGDVEADLDKVEAHGLELVLVQEDFELARSLGINGMPGALLLDEQGRIASEPAVGGVAVTRLLDSLAEAGETNEMLRLVQVGASG